MGVERGFGARGVGVSDGIGIAREDHHFVADVQPLVEQHQLVAFDADALGGAFERDDEIVLALGAVVVDGRHTVEEEPVEDERRLLRVALRQGLESRVADEAAHALRLAGHLRRHDLHVGIRGLVLDGLDREVSVGSERAANALRERSGLGQARVGIDEVVGLRDLRQHPVVVAKRADGLATGATRDLAHIGRQLGAAGRALVAVIHILLGDARFAHEAPVLDHLQRPALVHLRKLRRHEIVLRCEVDADMCDVEGAILLEAGEERAPDLHIRNDVRLPEGLHHHELGIETLPDAVGNPAPRWRHILIAPGLLDGAKSRTGLGEQGLGRKARIALHEAPGHRDALLWRLRQRGNPVQARGCANVLAHRPDHDRENGQCDEVVGERQAEDQPDDQIEEEAVVTATAATPITTAPITTAPITAAGAAGHGLSEPAGQQQRER